MNLIKIVLKIDIWNLIVILIFVDKNLIKLIEGDYNLNYLKF